MNWKYIVAGFFALLYIAYLLLNRQKGSSPQGVVNLSYDICLDTSSAYLVVDNDASARSRYTQSFWIDSTGQFFSKTLAGPSADTLFVSTFNRADLKSVNEAMEAAGFETIARRMEQGDRFRYQFLFSRFGTDAYFNRLLITDARFGAVTLIDQASRDSSAARQKYESHTITKYIKPCL